MPDTSFNVTSSHRLSFKQNVEFFTNVWYSFSNRSFFFLYTDFFLVFLRQIFFEFVQTADDIIPVICRNHIGTRSVIEIKHDLLHRIRISSTCNGALKLPRLIVCTCNRSKIISRCKIFLHRTQCFFFFYIDLLYPDHSRFIITDLLIGSLCQRMIQLFCQCILFICCTDLSLIQTDERFFLSP